MNEPSQREQATLEAALLLPAAQQRCYLEKLCAGQPAMRQRLESLIRAHEDAASTSQPPPTRNETILVTVPPTEKPGDHIGRYKLLQQIGEGGCGVVYMAEQEEPVRRRVALKVIKLGMDTRSVIARFEAERQGWP